MKPRRIQRRRTKGWKMPRNCTYVGRPGPWGNPYTVERYCNQWVVVLHDLVWVSTHATRRAAQKHAVELFETIILPTLRHRLHELRGKHPCCWCALTDPCHGDVLLREANR